MFRLAWRDIVGAVEWRWLAAAWTITIVVTAALVAADATTPIVALAVAAVAATVARAVPDPALLRQRRSRERSAPQSEPDQGWPDIEDMQRLRQTLSRRSFRAGVAGGDADGEPIRLAQIVEHAVEANVAQARVASHASLEGLERQIASAPDEAEKAITHAGDHDREVSRLMESAAQARERRDDVRAALAALEPSKRGTKGGVLASTSAGVLAGTVFALTLASVDGAMTVRVAIALTVTAAYAVIVTAAGRLLAEVWRHRRGSSARVAAAAGVFLLAALMAFVGDAILDSGREAATNLSFLVWVQALLTVAATGAIGAYHLGSEGAELRKEEAALTRRLRQLEAEARASQQRAFDARDRAHRIIADARAAEASLPRVAERVDREIEQLRATGRMSVEIIFESFEAGQTARAKAETPRPLRTIDAELAESVRRLKERMRGREGSDN